MWFITLILTLLFSVWLSEAKPQPLGNWITAFLASLVIGLLAEFIIAGVPSLTTFSLAKLTIEEIFVTHLAVAVLGVITGKLAVNIKKTLIK